jgi:hypothetical protein
MFRENPHDLSHFRFDARETLGGLALELQVAPFKLRVDAVGLRQATEKRRLVLDEHRHRFFEPIVPVR